MRLWFLALLLPLSACLLTDEDRDNLIDEKMAKDSWDADGDQYISFEFGGDDCDDWNPDVYPGAPEICDGYDNNCDEDIPTDERDADGDSYLACTVAGSIDMVEGLLGSGDCNDEDPTIFPGATEVCDDVDNDCDGVIDEDDAVDAPSWYTDADGDGYGADESEVVSCDQPSATVAEGGDCDDASAEVHPDATERPGDGNDMNCDGFELCYVDSDRDGYAEENGSPVESSDTTCTQPGLGDANMDRDDCNDAVASIHPGADEYCNSIDDDCDGTTDESDAVDATEWYADNDGDGFGNPAASVLACNQPASHVSDSQDCNDSNASINPSSAEDCLTVGVDDDCNGLADDDDSSPLNQSLWYADTDGDSYGNPNSFQSACTAPNGTVSDDTDCDDSSSVAHPGAQEVCDAADTDEDCDGLADDDDSSVTGGTGSWVPDADGDGYGSDSATPTALCDTPGSGWSYYTTDCNDSSSTVNPGVVEDCSGGSDEDCDGDWDCADSECTNNSACTTPSFEVCIDTTIDEDQDGYSNCGDSDCYDHFTAACYSPVPINSGSSQPWNIYPHYGITNSQQLPKLIELECGGMHTCYKTDNDDLRCWGGDSEGQSSEWSNNYTWRHVTSGGTHSCATQKQGRNKVWCWGDDHFGQSGGASTPVNGALQLALDLTGNSVKVDDIAAGYHHTCAITDAATVLCWGDSSYGATSVTAAQATTIANAGGLTMIDAGGYHTCGIAADGSLHCWGRNDKDQVGQYGLSGPNGGSGIQYQDVAAGELHTCALRANGVQIECDGDHTLGQTTPPHTGSTYAGQDGTNYHPVAFSSLSAFGHHTCAEVDMAPEGSLSSTHTSVVCWGSDENGQVSGAPVNSGEFTNHPDTDLACAGGRHNCVYLELASGNELHCWGDGCQAQDCFDQPGSCTFATDCY